ncbi:hypothetical protein C0Q70_04138 [Pomacea canaliculata]|uniref:Uncharacterized protein n=1 Tax=Pomacea canaliculata TaxID=400727 RepID=A0A2T7PUP3_POMCA|nr:hypothetical protein C0Q70_04138 [Pomacea canaliculata]
MLPITPQGHPPASAVCSNLNASAGCLPHHWLGNMAPSLGPRELRLSATSCRVVLTRCDLCARVTGHGSRTACGRRAACVSLKIIIYRYELTGDARGQHQCRGVALARLEASREERQLLNESFN